VEILVVNVRAQAAFAIEVDPRHGLTRAVKVESSGPDRNTQTLVSFNPRSTVASRSPQGQHVFQPRMFIERAVGEPLDRKGASECRLSV
jgi:hypothetical protein